MEDRNMFQRRGAATANDVSVSCHLAEAEF